MAWQQHEGPLVVQRPFYPEGQRVCHVYLLHPPGGLVPGDALAVDVEVGEKASVLVTAPAATKVYRSDGRRSAIEQRLRAASGAVLEWLPPETIVFDGARAQVTTAIDLVGDASFLGWEVVCLGRPACGERFLNGCCRLRLELRREGRPLVLERTTFDAEVQDAVWGLGGAPVVGTMLAAWPGVDGTDICEQLAKDLVAAPGEHVACTRVRGALVVRYLGSSTERVRGLFEQAWRVLRPLVAQRAPCPPRIWST